MQAALSFGPAFIPWRTPCKPQSFALPLRPVSAKLPLLLASSTEAAATATDPSSVDYSSMNSSVFPAEACETVGGEACDVEMYPEIKLEPAPGDGKPQTAAEQVEREYLDYNSPKTVFPGDACDEFGGEFCQPEYQTGVY